MAEVTLELIDLNLDRDEEFEKFGKLNEETKEEETKEEETKEEETKEEETKEEETKEEETKEEETKEEETKEEETKEEETKKEEPKEDTKAILEELRAERQRLQAQLNEIAVAAMVDRRKLAEIEKSAIAKKEEEPEGPTPAEILSQIDRRITEVDAALTKAEQENPTEAPALRQELRQLERYYTNYLAQQQLLAQQGPDPADLVQLAASEAQQQTAFQAVKQSIIDQYPILNTKSEVFNAELRDKVHRVYNPMLKEGMDPVDSLVEATMLVMRAHGIPSISEIQQMNAEKEATDKAAAEKAVADKAVADKIAANKPASTARKADAVTRNVKAEKAVPPTIANIGRSSDAQGTLDKYDFGKMSINEFMKISDEEEERIEAALSLYSGE